jgi:hypothetical protein
MILNSRDNLELLEETRKFSMKETENASFALKKFFKMERDSVFWKIVLIVSV